MCLRQLVRLISLVTAALGQSADVCIAVSHVNQFGSIPGNAMAHPDAVVCMKKLCVSQGWAEPPEEFTQSD